MGLQGLTDSANRSNLGWSHTTRLTTMDDTLLGGPTLSGRTPDSEMTEAEREAKMQEYGKLLEEMQREDPAKYRAFVDAMQQQVNAAKGFEPALPGAGGRVMRKDGVATDAAQRAQREGEEVTPVPGFVVKTKDAATEAKVFINICQSTIVGAPAPTKRVVNDVLQEGMSMPISLGAGRVSQDKAGGEVTIYDCIVNPAVVTQATKGDLSGEYRHLVCQTAIQYISQKYARTLDQRYKLIRSKYKGEVVSQWVRSKRKGGSSGPAIQELGKDGPSEREVKRKRKLAAARDAARRAPKSSVRHSIFGDYAAAASDAAGSSGAAQRPPLYRKIPAATFGEERWQSRARAEEEEPPSAATKVSVAEGGAVSSALRLAPAPRALLLVFEFNRDALARARALEEAEAEAEAEDGVAGAMPRHALPPGLELSLSRRMAAVTCRQHVPLQLLLPFAVSTDASLVVVDAVTAYCEATAQLRVSLRVDGAANRPASGFVVEGGDGSATARSAASWRRPDPGSRPWMITEAIARSDDEEREEADARAAKAKAAAGPGGDETGANAASDAAKAARRAKTVKLRSGEEEILPEDKFLSSDILSQHWIREKEREKEGKERKAEEKRARQRSGEEDTPIDLVEYAKQNDPQYAVQQALEAYKAEVIASIPERPAVAPGLAADATFGDEGDDAPTLVSEGIFALLDDFGDVGGSAADI